MLSNDEYEFFRQHSYLVLSDVFTSEEVRQPSFNGKVE